MALHTKIRPLHYMRAGGYVKYGYSLYNTDDGLFFISRMFVAGKPVGNQWIIRQRVSIDEYADLWGFVFKSGILRASFSSRADAVNALQYTIRVYELGTV